MRPCLQRKGETKKINPRIFQKKLFKKGQLIPGKIKDNKNYKKKTEDRKNKNRSSACWEKIVPVSSFNKTKCKKAIMTKVNFPQ